MKKPRKPNLKLVDTSAATTASTTSNPFDPPANLGKSGASTWRSIMSAYEIRDAGGIELLGQLCGALDDLAATSKTIAHDGLMVRTGNGGVREHPLLRHQISLRSFISRTIQRLGLDVEAIKPVGR